MTDICPKCNGTGRIVDQSGIHTCFDCLNSGRLDSYSKELKTSEKPILRWGEKKELSSENK